MERTIKSEKWYRVVRFEGKKISDYGVLEGVDVKPMIRGYRWWKPEWSRDEDGMWFSPKAQVAYSIEEVK